MSCREDILKAIQEGRLPKMSATEAEAIIGDVERIRQFVGERDGVIGPNFSKEVQQELLRQRVDRTVKAMEAKQNVLKLSSSLDYVLQDQFKGRENKGILAKLLGGELALTKGGNKSVAKAAEGLHETRVSGMYLKLKDAGLIEVSQSGVIDRDTAQEQYLLDHGRSGETKNDQALEQAKIYRAATDSMLNDKRAAGSGVRRAVGYIAKTTHDRTKILEAGFDSWKEDILKYIDRKETYGFSSDQYIENHLKSVYDSIVSDEPASNVYERTGKNVSREQSLARTFIMKDGYSWHDYNAKYGKSNLLGTILTESRKAAGQTAMMAEFGTNYEEGFRKLTALVENKIDRKFTKGEKQNMAAAFARAQGFSDTPGTEIGARIGQGIRIWESLAKTGGASLSTMTDLAFSAAQIQSTTGENMLSEAASQLGTFFSSIQDADTRGRVAAKLGIKLDQFGSHLLSKLGADAGEGAFLGKLSKAAQMFQKLNLMKYVDEAAAVTGALHYSNSLAEIAGTAWESLNAKVKSGLERYGFNDRSWALVSRAIEEFNGIKLMTNESLRALPDEVVREIYPEGNPERHRFNASVSLLSAFGETADASASRASPRVKHILLGESLDDGSWGTLRRMIVQFKQPMLMNLRTAGQTLLSNPLSKPTTLLGAAAGKGDIYGFVSLFMLSTMLGYAKITAQGFAQGKNSPPDPKDPNTVRKAFLAGGVAGIYGDMMFGELHRNYGTGSLDMAAGPTLGEGARILDMGMKAQQGEAKWKDVWRETWNNVPGHNLFYFRGALNHLIDNNIQEYLNPGHKQRMEQRVRQEPALGGGQQGYWMFQPTSSNFLGYPNR